MTAKLIGIVGYKGSGKTTVTQAAIGHFTDYQHMSFSTPIINMLESLGVPLDVINDKKRWNEPLDILCGKTLRHASTTLGTEWGRDCIHPALWTNIALNLADDYIADGNSVIIDNVRFPTEFEIMSSKGAKFIAMKRPDLVPDLSHSSEQHIEELQKRCDIAVYNIDFNVAAHEMLGILYRMTA